MDLHGFDLNLLVALDALLKERSVTNAGRRVHLSQPAMSAALARLRHAFNDELLVAGRVGMTLTPLAEQLVEPVAVILSQTQATLSTHTRFDPATSRRAFRLAASDYSTTVLLDDVLRDISGQAPQVTTTILPLRGGEEQAEEPDIDLHILPQAVIPPARPHALLFRDTFTCIVWRDHPDIGDRLTLDQFTSLGHVVVSFADAHRSGRDERFAPHVGLARRAEVVVSNFHALPGLVVGTRRLATIQTRLANKLAASSPIRLVGLPVPMAPLDEAMMWHPRFERDPAHMWLRAQLLRIAAAMPAEPEQVRGESATVRRGRFGSHTGTTKRSHS